MFVYGRHLFHCSIDFFFYICLEMQESGRRKNENGKGERGKEK